jgi:hypothetical protein
MLIKVRKVAHRIQEKWKLRGPGPCYQCLHKRKSKGSEFPTCMITVDGRRRRYAWCTNQQQPCTDEKPQSWTKKWRRQGKDNSESQEEHGNANGDVGKTENSQMTRLRVEDGSMPAQTESHLGCKVRCFSSRTRLYEGAVVEADL